MATQYSISDLAAEFGLSLRALRFYEAKGLLVPARSGTRRVYSDADREKVAQITLWTSQGFTLTEIKDALKKGGFTANQLLAQLAYLRERQKEIGAAIELLEHQLGNVVPTSPGLRAVRPKRKL